MRFRPTGVARVRIAVRADARRREPRRHRRDDGVRAAEPRLPRLVTDPLLRARNSLSLQRLRHEVERRAEAPVTSRLTEAFEKTRTISAIRARGRYVSPWRRRKNRCPPPTRSPAPTPPEELYRYEGAPVPFPKNEGHFLLRFWRSAVGKKWVMALSGIVLLGYVLAHMVGNLKVFLGETHLNEYARVAARPRRAGVPPHASCCGRMRIVLIAAFVFHIVAAYQLTRMNQKARPVKYQSPRDYVGGQLRLTHDALDRRDRRPVRDLPPARPHVGLGQPRLRARRRRTTTSSTASNGCRSRSSTSSRWSRSASTSSTAPGHVPEPRHQQPAVQRLAARTSRSGSRVVILSATSACRC